jgi:hypothetical protein
MRDSVLQFNVVMLATLLVYGVVKVGNAMTQSAKTLELERPVHPVGTYSISCYGFSGSYDAVIKSSDRVTCVRLNTRTGAAAIINPRSMQEEQP